MTRPGGAGLAVLLLAAPLGAWTPRVHEAQTAQALKLVPRGMAALLRAHPEALMEGARGVAHDEPPTAAAVEAQFRTVLRMSGERRRPQEIVRDLGVLAHQVQLLLDPSAREGLSPLRESFESFAEERLPNLLVTREPFWAASGSLDPGPALQRMAEVKAARHLRLQAHFDPAAGRRLGTWDDLSVPFAQLQLAYSNGVHATANLWILAWRAAGDQWVPPAGTP